MLDWALDDLATNQTDSAKDLVCSAMTQLAERQLEPTTAQRERAANSGVCWRHPMDRGGAAARSSDDTLDQVAANMRRPSIL